MIPKYSVQSVLPLSKPISTPLSKPPTGCTSLTLTLQKAKTLPHALIPTSLSIPRSVLPYMNQKPRGVWRKAAQGLLDSQASSARKQLVQLTPA